MRRDFALERTAREVTIEGNGEIGIALDGDADRVLVMSEGRLTANIPRAEATQESIMRAAVPRSSNAAVAA